MKIFSGNGDMDDNTAGILRQVWRAEADAVAGLADTMDYGALARVHDTLATCSGRILTTGAGTSGAAARKIAHSLCCIERPALFLSPADAVHGGLGVVQPGDCVVAISKGGNTREIAAMLEAFATKNVTLIGVTENDDSLLARQSSIHLKVKVDREPDTFNMLATASTMAVVAVFDALCIALMRTTGFTRSQFAIIHPGGAVGERLISAETV